MHCPECGASCTKEDAFCGECGRPLSTEAPPGESASTPRAEGEATGTTAPAPVTPQPTRSRSRSVLKVGGAIFLLLLLCIIGARILFSTFEEAASKAGDSVPAVGGRLLYLHRDDFHDPGSGWDAWDDGDTSAKYMDGEYRLGVTRRNYMVWSYPANSRVLRNFVLEVDARQVEGSLDSTFGPIVRLQTEEENYYWFQISGDGHFSVELKEEGEWFLLHEWEASSAIKQGLDASNHIRLICDRDRLSFYVNGVHLADVTDNTLRTGIIGLAAGAYTEPPVVVSFDNLFVYKLQE